MASKLCASGATGVVDIGCGTGMLGIALRHLRFSGPIIHIDYAAPALALAQYMAESIDHGEMLYVGVNMTAMLATNREALLNVLKLPAGFFIASRGAIHPAYEPLDYERLIELMIGDLGAAGGVHMELLGHHTPTFSTLPANRPRGKYEHLAGDVFKYLRAHPDVSSRTAGHLAALSSFIRRRSAIFTVVAQEDRLAVEEGAPVRRPRAWPEEPGCSVRTMQKTQRCRID